VLIIGLDIRPIQSLDSRYRGLRIYGENFINHLLSIDNSRRYILFCSKIRSLSELRLRPDTEIFYLKRAARLQWIQDQIFSPWEIMSKKLDLFHALDSNIPFIKTSKIIVSIHDLIPLTFPKYYLPKATSRIWYHMQLQAIRQADKIIANSYHTKKDLIRFIGMPEGKIKVIYYGLDNVYKTQPDKDAWIRLKARLNINKDYILYVGSFDQRKNIPFLLTVFKTIRENMDLSLVLAGRYTERDYHIFKQTKELGLEEDIIFTGFLEREDMHVLYAFAQVLAFPSLYEGFGLPLIEAMASSCPVVAFASSCVPEIVMDAAVLVEPDNKEEFIKAIISVVRDNNQRAELVKKGLRRAADFSWDKAAQETVKTYDEVLRY
jgi:glycosyltransferase involved in cell wall biosynthesis